MKDMDKVQYGRMNDKPAVPAESNLHSERSIQSLGVQNKGIVAFPDILVPATYKYMDDYIYPASQLTTHKYKQRYPDTNSVSFKYENKFCFIRKLFLIARVGGDTSLL